MNTNRTLMLAIASALFAVPAAGFAQSYDPDQGPAPYGQPQYGQPEYDQPGYDQRGYDQRGYEPRGYGEPDYDQPRGDYGEERQAPAGVYPQFRGIDAHIQHEIRDGLREDLLAPDDARDLMGRLRQIRYEEMREYRVHGWRLPWGDQARIQGELARLDQLVDQTRAEP